MNKGIKIILLLLGFFIVSFIISSLLSSSEVFDEIAIIEITGPITTFTKSVPFTSSGVSPEKIIEFLDEAQKDKAIKGIILEINSPGGTAVASREIANKVKSMEKPVVSWIREIGASGAYWIASSSDLIVADELSIVGSVGATSSYLEFTDLFEKYGITYENITAGSLKELGSPYKKLTSEERKILLSKLDTIHKIFLEDVAKNRKLSPDELERISTGEFFLGKEAKALGLIDEFGSKEQAINMTKKLANVTEASIVKYESGGSILDYLKGVSTEAFFNVGLGISKGFVEETESQKITFKA